VIAIGVLLAYALLVGVAVPHLFARAGWTQRAPGLAVLVWQGLLLSFVSALVLLAHHAVVPERHTHGGVLGFLHVCGAANVDAAEAPGEVVRLLVPLTVLLWPLGWYALTLARAYRGRRRHAARLDILAHPAPDFPALLIEHDVPAVYCLPGRLRRVVLTRGALDVLSHRQLRAVLAHEQAHLAGRHHLITAATEAFVRAFPGLPLGRLAWTETAVLLEMVADDRASRTHSPSALAEAMCEVAAGQAPGFAFGLGGSAVVLRVRRLLHPRRGPHPAAWWSAVGLTLAATVVPFVVACGPGLG